jgi:hypothetical protein
VGNRLVPLLALLFAAGQVPAQAPLSTAPAATEFACERPEPPTPLTSFASDEPSRFWLRGEYVHWSVKGAGVPPLITSAPATSAAAVPGAFGNPDTATVFGNDHVNSQPRSGWRATGGFWLDEDRTLGLDGSVFALSPTTRTFIAASDGATTSLFRPIFNTATGRPGVEDVTSLADGIVGRVSVQSRLAFCGGDVNLRSLLCGDETCAEGFRVDALVGYRALLLKEDLNVGENLTTLDLAGLPNGTIAVLDQFHTRNLFQGGQVGIDAEWWRGRWFLGARGAVAVGVVRETVEINGGTATAALGGTPIVQTGGLLALPTNIGTYHRTDFGYSPSLGLRLGCQWTPWLRTAIGYDVVYLNSVVRPGNQIDLAVNPAQVPPALGAPYVPARPAFAFHGTDFWAQGVSVSVEFRF